MTQLSYWAHTYKVILHILLWNQIFSLLNIYWNNILNLSSKAHDFMSGKKISILWLFSVFNSIHFLTYFSTFWNFNEIITKMLNYLWKNMKLKEMYTNIFHFWEIFLMFKSNTSKWDCLMTLVISLQCLFFPI